MRARGLFIKSRLSDCVRRLLKPRFHHGSPNPAGCAGTGFCAGCNDVNAIFRFNGTTHVFYQHTETPEYNGSRVPAAWRVCWAHAASRDNVRWRNFGCVGSWDKAFGVAWDGALLGLDPVSGPVLLYDAFINGTTMQKGHDIVQFGEVMVTPVESGCGSGWRQCERCGSGGAQASARGHQSAPPRQ